jgi:uncharacterized phage-associated protein
MTRLRRFNTFNIEKIIQVLAHIQRKIDCTDKLKLIKLLFFADRTHLRRYLSFISFDIYYALRNGPAASKTLNIINRYEDLVETTENLKLLEKIEIVDRNTRIINEKSTDFMSKVEMQVLDSVCEIFGNYSTDAIVDITHDYPEWKRYEELFKTGANGDCGELIILDDFFKNPDIADSQALKTYFNGVDPLYEEEDYLKDAKDIFLENERMKNGYC